MQNDIVRRPSPPPQERATPPQQPQQQQPVVQQNPEQVPLQQPQTTPAIAATETLSTVETAAPTTAPVQDQPKKRSGLPLGIIIAAVVICLALVGGAIYLGMNKTKVDPVVNKVNEITTTAPSATAAPANVDAVVTEANGLPEDTTDPSTELSDQALGL